MKVKIEIDCTPLEARTFLGLPDVSGLNDQVLQQMKAHIDANMGLMQPEELVKSWSAFGSQAQDQFRKLMAAATDTALSGRDRS